MLVYIPFFLVVILTTVFTSLLIKRGGLSTDTPNHRSSHKVATPRGGGAAFCLAVSCVLCLEVIWSYFFNSGYSDLQVKRLIIYLCLISAMSLLGAFEDIKNLPAMPRFLFEIVIAGVAVTYGYFWKSLNIFGFDLAIPTFALQVFSVIWIVWTTNLFNFMDGVNGIAAVTGIIVCSIFALLLHQTGGAVGSQIALLIAAALCAFLPYNFPRAKIFMGDVGSLTLGFAIALFQISLADHSSVPINPMWAVVSLAPFFIDATLTLIIRFLYRQNILQAHRWHTYQRLADLSNSHMTTTVIFGVWQVAFSLCLVAYLSPTFQLYAGVSALSVSILFLGFMGVIWGKVPRAI